MSFLKRSIIACALLLVWRSASAQSAADKLYIGVQNLAGSELNERDGSVQERGIIAGASTPIIPLAPGTLLRLGAGYRRLTVDLDDGAALPGEPALRNLNAIDAFVSLTQMLSPHWSLSAGFAPGIRTDFDQSFSGKDLQYGGFAIASYTYGARYQYTFSFGLAAKTRATLLPVLPIASFMYRGERFFFEGAATGVNAFWRFDRLEAGLFFSFDDAFYHVTAPRDPQLLQGTFLRATNMAIGPMLNVRLAGSLWLETRTGYAFTRFLRYNDDDLNRVDRGINMDPKGALLLQVGLGFGDRTRRRPPPKPSTTEAPAPAR